MRRWYFARRCSCFLKLLSGAKNVPSLRVAKRAMPTSMPVLGPCGRGCSTSRRMRTETNHLPPLLDTVTLRSAQCAEREPAVAIANPAQLGQKNPPVLALQLYLFRVRVTKTVSVAFLFKARKVRTLGEEIGVGKLQVLERLLCRVNRRVLEPRGVRAVTPFGELLAQARVAKFLLGALVALFLQRQCLVKDEPARTSESAHVVRLLAGRHQFVFKGSEDFHV